MASNAGRGAYFKGRTRRHFEALGWLVADLEVVRWLHPPGRERVPVKRDQLGADLLLVNVELIVFAQVKGGAQAVGAGTFPQARAEFEKFIYPPYVKLWIVAWAPRARTPRIIVCQ
jgi:hypothetical protein